MIKKPMKNMKKIKLRKMDVVKGKGRCRCGMS